jgi:MerR family mercuric resistance operon transcriptional regulator
MHRLTVGEVAKRAAVHIETLRYYERQGLVARPPRSRSNYRLYPEETVQRIQFIKRAQQLGFSLKEIRELLALRATPQIQCADVRERALAKIREIEHKVRTLQAMHTALTRLVAACAGQGHIADCPILESLNTDEHASTDQEALS